MTNIEKNNLIVKEINDVLQTKRSPAAKQRAALKYIKERLGHSPTIINHQRYKSNSIILFIHEENLFAVKIAGGRYQNCQYASLYELEGLDVYKQKNVYNSFLTDLCRVWGFCLDVSYDSYLYYKKYYDKWYVVYGHQYYKKYDRVSKNFYRSAQLLQILFET